MIPSHTKVAWAFLDKLLGRTPPKPDRDPSTMTMADRNQWLTDSTTDMAKVMDKALAKFAKEFTQQVHRVAPGYGLDPRALFHRMMQQRQKWPRMPHDQRRWLDIAASIAAAYGNVPLMPGRVEFSPEVNSLMGTAFSELGRWVKTNMKPDLEQTYLKVLQNEARQLVPVYTYPGEPVPTLPKVTLALMHEFEWRLEHAKLPVGSAQLMERLFRLFT